MKEKFHDKKIMMKDNYNINNNNFNKKFHNLLINKYLVSVRRLILINLNIANNHIMKVNNSINHSNNIISQIITINLINYIKDDYYNYFKILFTNFS